MRRKEGAQLNCASSIFCQEFSRARAWRRKWIAQATLVFLLASFARGQDWQFLFDARGNLIVQTAESTAPPQILGQPPNQIVAPGEAATFFVLLADTRAVSYQWRFGTTNIAGATGDALLLE